MVKKLVGAAAESDKSHSHDHSESNDNYSPSLNSPTNNNNNNINSTSSNRIRSESTASSSRSSMKQQQQQSQDGRSKESVLLSEALHKGSFLKSKRKTLDFTTPHHTLVHSNSFNSGGNRRRKPKGPLRLYGSDLQQLLLIKPELTEFLFLEIQNMKLDESMNINTTNTH